MLRIEYFNEKKKEQLKLIQTTAKVMKNGMWHLSSTDNAAVSHQNETNLTSKIIFSNNFAFNVVLKRVKVP